MVSHCVFNLHFLMANGVQHLLMHCFPIQLSSLEMFTQVLCSLYWCHIEEPHRKSKVVKIYSYISLLISVALKHIFGRYFPWLWNTGFVLKYSSATHDH